MNLTKKQLFLLNEVLSKVKKNELTGKYTIYPQDYISLNLNKRTMQMLERMCKKHNIDIEKLPERISAKKTDDLFRKYNYLKKFIQENPTHQEIPSLEKEMIELKHAIALGHIEVMYLLINSEFPNLIKEQDSEDIYQTGYEVLVWAIDKYDINRGITFAKYIRDIIIHRLAEEIWKTKRSIKITDARELISILAKKDATSKEELTELSIEEIKKQKDLKEARINYLLSLIDLSHEKSIEELPEYYLSEDDFEKELLNQIEKNSVAILLETLPEIQKQILKLYYGFIDDKRHTYEEIANILGYNNSERVRQIKEEALSTLSIPVYQSIIGAFSENTEIIESRYNEVKKAYRDKRESELEDIIIKSLPTYVLTKLIEEFPPMYKDVLELYYGLKDGVNYTTKEISIILGKKEYVIKERKREGVRRIANKIDQNSNKPYMYTLVQGYVARKSKRR